jgi:hypothetical protein
MQGATRDLRDLRKSIDAGTVVLTGANLREDGKCAVRHFEYLTFHPLHTFADPGLDPDGHAGLHRVHGDRSIGIAA